MKPTIVRNIPRADADVIRTLGQLGVATVHEAQARTGLMRPYMRPIYPTARAVGSAVTVLCAPGDNLMIHAAIEVLKPGDILVVTTFSESTDGMFGDLLAVSTRTHGGGAVPYHWGRYRGLAQDLKRPLLTDLIRDNVYFDTCVYHQPGVDLLLKVVPADNVLFGSEMVGAVRGIDPETGHYYDDTKRYVDAAAISDDAKRKIFEGNARKVYPRMKIEERL